MFYGVVYEITNSKSFEFFHELPSREKEQQSTSFKQWENNISRD